MKTASTVSLRLFRNTSRKAAHPARRQRQSRKNRQKGYPRLVAAENAAQVGHEKGVGGKGDQGQEGHLDKDIVAQPAPSCDNRNQAACDRKPDQANKR